MLLFIPFSANSDVGRGQPPIRLKLQTVDFVPNSFIPPTKCLHRLGAFGIMKHGPKHGRSRAGLMNILKKPWPKGACVNCSRSPWPTCCGSWRVWLCLVQNNPLPPIHIKHSHSMVPICPNYVEVPYQMVFGGVFNIRGKGFLLGIFAGVQSQELKVRTNRSL